MEWLLVLLSEVCCHTTHRLRNTHTCVCVCEYTHTHTQHAASTLYPKHCSCLLQYMHCAQESGFGSALSFFFFSFLFFLHVLLLELSLPPSICCIWTAAQDEKKPKQTWQYLASPPPLFNDLPLFWTQTCQKHHWRQDAGWMDGRMCAAGGRHEREKLKPTCCANDVYMSACESVLCLLKT